MRCWKPGKWTKERLSNHYIRQKHQWSGRTRGKSNTGQGLETEKKKKNLIGRPDTQHTRSWSRGCDIADALKTYPKWRIRQLQPRRTCPPGTPDIGSPHPDTYRIQGLFSHSYMKTKHLQGNEISLKSILSKTGKGSVGNSMVQETV